MDEINIGNFLISITCSLHVEDIFKKISKFNVRKDFGFWDKEWNCLSNRYAKY